MRRASLACAFNGKVYCLDFQPMRKKIDITNLNWGEAARSRLAWPLHSFRHIALTPLSPETGAEPHSRAEPPGAESAEKRRERLRNEIACGAEYLAEVQRELRENRELLEHWAEYEASCLLQPLDHLMQSVMLKERVEQFLLAWLERRQAELAKLA
jgi:hypothetical protein